MRDHRTRRLGSAGQETAPDRIEALVTMVVRAILADLQTDGVDAAVASSACRPSRRVPQLRRDGRDRRDACRPLAGRGARS